MTPQGDPTLPDAGDETPAAPERDPSLPSPSPDGAPDLFGAAAAASKGGPTRRGLKPDDHRHGHRARLRDRFAASGSEGVADYELLELLLFRSLRRGDVKPLAKRLLAEFGDLAGVLEADPARLQRVEGLGEVAALDLKIVAAAGRSLSRARLQKAPVMGGAEAVIDYCRAALGRSAVEEFRVLFLDRKNRLIADETLGRGTVDQVAVYPREVVKRALELAASGVILVHNHPSGDATPSAADKALTRRIVEAAETLDVAVLDHIVIGAASAESFRRLKLL